MLTSVAAVSFAMAANISFFLQENKCIENNNNNNNKEKKQYNIFATSTVEPRYPNTQFSCHSAYHVSFSKFLLSACDFNVNKLRMLHH